MVSWYMVYALVRWIWITSNSLEMGYCRIISLSYQLRRSST
ncbi:hypothetical protein FOCG_17951 [Fusarium oxysporum f. sp. radicis-lycopersici 26381]|nr:hypothetical protein FOCG_17951 [Fusarium oxysporum f. sp. radicis-lycopersici 26381]